MIAKPIRAGVGIVILVGACSQGPAPSTEPPTDLDTNVAALGTGAGGSPNRIYQLHFGLNTRDLPNSNNSLVETDRTLPSIPVCEYSRGGGGSGGQNGILSCTNPAAVVYDSGSDEQRTLTNNEAIESIYAPARVFQVYRGWHSIPICRSLRSGGQPTWDCINPQAGIYDSGSPEQQFFTADLNYDGQTDILQTYREWNSIPICLGAYNGWSCSNPYAVIIHSGSPEERFLTGDFDGDQRTDVIQVYRSRPMISTCLSRSGTWSCSQPYADIYDSGDSRQQFLTGDFDGDHRTDLVQVFQGWSSIPLCLSTGSGWNCSNPWTSLVYDNQVTWAVADFNGDGKSDVLESTSDGRTFVFLSTGTGWTRVDGPVGLTRVAAVDVDGDGVPDIAGPTGYGLYACFTNTNGGTTPTWNCQSMSTSGVP
jgi:hypothetical protein